MNRILRVIRLQTTAWTHVVAWPWAVMASSFVINLLIFSLMRGQLDVEPTTGGLASLYGTALAMAAVSVTQLFPYALGMSVTRREFYLAWSLLAAAQSVAYGLVLYLLNAVERATGGWGIAMRFFGPPLIEDANPVLQLLVYAIPMLFVTYVGIFFATVHLRWGATGIFASFVLAIVGFGLLGALITWARQWGAIGHWLANQPPAALFAGWPVFAVAAMALAGYAVIRRVTA